MTELKTTPDAAQSTLKIAQNSIEEILEVHRGSGQDSFDRIAYNTLQKVGFQPVYVLQVSDVRFDCGAAFYPSPEQRRNVAQKAAQTRWAKKGEKA